MKKRNNKNKLEDLFRSYFNNAEKVNRPAGWNQPPEEVWSGIQEGLAIEREAQRKFLFWKWLAVAASLLLLLSVFQLYKSNQQIQGLATQLAKNKEVVQKIQSDLKVLTEENIEEGFENFQVIDNQIVKHINDKEKLNVTSVPFKTKTTKEKTVFNNVNVVSATFNSKHVASNVPNNQLGAFHAASDVKLTNLEGQKSTIKQNTEMLNPLSKQERTVQTVSILDKKGGSIDKLAIANQKIDWTNLSIVPVLNKQPHFYLSVDYAPVLNTVKSKGFQLGRNEYFPRKEVQETAYNTGIQVGMTWGKGWSVETGLRYNSVKKSISHNRVITYDKLAEKLNNNGDYESRVNFQLGSSAGPTETDVSFARASSATVAEDTKIKMNIAFAHTSSYLDLPLLVKKEWSIGSLALGIKAGLLNRFLLDKSLSSQEVTIENKRFNTTTTSFRERSNPKNKNNYSAHYLAGIGLEYNFQTGLSMYVEPTFIRSIQPIIGLSDASLYTQSQMINVGVRYKY